MRHRISMWAWRRSVRLKAEAARRLEGANSSRRYRSRLWFELHLWLIGLYSRAEFTQAITKQRQKRRAQRAAAKAGSAIPPGAAASARLVPPRPSQLGAPIQIDGSQGPSMAARPVSYSPSHGAGRADPSVPRQTGPGRWDLV